MFNEIKNRDAWSTLRGFVYQVDITILRWLNLKDNQILELEKGEDIDIVSRNIEQNEISRELEQVKYREANITLNLNIVQEILLNFFLHKQKNPAQNILLRFVTNSSYGIERPALFPEGKSGVETWIELSSCNVIPPEDSRLIILKAFLLKKIGENLIDENKIDTTKKEIAQQNWKDFSKYIQNDENLIQFIKDFEWSFKNDRYDHISRTITERLLDEGLVSDQQSAEIIYSKLFLYVFKQLSKSTIKVLDRSGLKDQLILKELSPADQRLQETLINILTILQSKVVELAEVSKINSKQISLLIDDVKLINNSDTVFNYRLNNISIDPPALTKNGTLRESKVGNILKVLHERSWIGFKGINGTGKSQLAALVCQKFNNFFWLDLQAYNQNIEKTTLLIETFLSEISGYPISNDRGNWINNLINALPKNTLIVFNDLPRVNNNSPLGNLLVSLVERISFTEIKLLTTSNFQIPSVILQSLDKSLFQEYFDFGFTDEEIIECLVNNGASGTILKYINLIIAISNRNPRLIGAIIYHLKSMNWGVDSDVLFDILFTKEFSSEILEDAQLSIRSFIKDESSRELLYRLSLIHWGFKFNDVKLISEVENKIIHPNEKLRDLTNLWVQEQGDLYQISPLIYDIGKMNLAQEVIESVHLAIAKSILSTKKLDQLSASRCITSFINGKDYNNAGLVLLNLLNSAQTVQQIKYLEKWGAFNYWSDLDIPKKMSVVLRSNIRNQQIRIYRSIEKDPRFFIDKLQEYEKESLLSISERTVICFMILGNYNLEALDNYWYYLGFVIKHFSELEDPIRNSISAEMFVSLLWIPVRVLEQEKDIKLWLNNINEVESIFDVNFFDNDIAQDAIAVLSSTIANSENNKLERDKSWQSTVDRLTLLERYFRTRNLEILAAVIIADLVVLEFNVFNNQAEAELKTIKEAANLSSADAKYLLYQNIGKLYYSISNLSESIHWLFKAIDLNCLGQVNYIDTLIYGASAISSSDSLEAVNLCAKAVELGEKREDFSEFDYIQIVGELGIAYWINENFEQSFECFEKAIISLTEIRDKCFGPSWVRLFSWFGHALGYISASVAGDKVPESLRDGGAYVKPYQGLFSFNRNDLTQLYKSKNDPIILVHLAIFADGINEVSKTYYWSLKAFDLARKNKDEQVLVMISSVCRQYCLINFEIEEAFETFLLFSAVSNYLKGTQEDKYSGLGDIKLTEVLKSKPSENWSTAEDLTLSFTITFLIIMILTAYLENPGKSNQWYERYRKMISDYIPSASDKFLWELVLELSTRIILKTISEGELQQRSSIFSQNGRRNLQIICIIGMIYISEDNSAALTQIINIIPYLVKLNRSSRSIVKFVLLPFVKCRCQKILKDSFVGNRDDLLKILTEIDNVNSSDEIAMQLILRPVVKELKIEVVESRKPWLYDNREI